MERDLTKPHEIYDILVHGIVMRVCRTCRRTKDLDKFHKHSRRNLGREYQCKFCKKKYKRNYDKGSTVTDIKVKARKKRCSKCDKNKLKNQFSPNLGTVDGLQSWCRSCSRKYGALGDLL